MWLLFKKIKIIKQKKNIVYITTVSTLIFYFIISGLFFNFKEKTQNIEFNKYVWNNNEFERYKMIDNLLKTNIINGKDSTEIKSLLGTPNSKDLRKAEWIYLIIINKSFDHEIKKLKIKFEKNISNNINYE